MNELDQLAGVVAAADEHAAAGLPPQPGQEPEPPAPVVPGADEQAVDLVNTFAGLLAAYAPDTAAIWTEHARQASAAAIAPLMIKYNISITAMPPELTAAIVVGPLLYRSATIVGEKMRADRAAKHSPAVAAPAPKTAANDTAASAPPAPPAQDPNQSPAVAVHPQMALYS
ncbi:hypothetical protein [Duganella qianjiadongensis]|uniref:Uncharacterized protein n=1 Tax=Duganella qianjiadongensis TaxID=2692176 RepID=A0ABW9VMJ7_9BURK|nr:hypothetical protein [Duganella qianjiadongensis]MYM39653.1 hypothetical protein [Duganella qianjiadongensis]